MHDEAMPGAIRYGRDVTSADVEALASFLSERIARLSQAERGSDERQLARGVKASMLLLVGTLEHCVPALRETPKEGEVQVRIRTQIRMSWNALWALASPWQGHHDYKRERWRHVKHWDAAEETAFEDILRHSRSEKP